MRNEIEAHDPDRLAEATEAVAAAITKAVWAWASDGQDPGPRHHDRDGWSPGAGSTLALLAPDNATGNFTKVVQRMPVKIVLDADPALGTLVRPGMSAEATIDKASRRATWPDDRWPAQRESDGAARRSRQRVERLVGGQ